MEVPETTFPEVWLEDKRRKQRIIPVTREIAEKLRAQGIEVLTIPAREWKNAAYKMDKAIKKLKDIPPELLEINAANQATLQKQQEKRRQQVATSGKEAAPDKKPEAPHPPWIDFHWRLNMHVYRIPQWLEAICKDCEDYMDIKREKIPRAAALMTQMLYRAGGNPSEVWQCVSGFLERYSGYNRKYSLYLGRLSKSFDENGQRTYDENLENYKNKLFALRNRLHKYAQKLAWHFLPPRMRRGWHHRLPQPRWRPKNRWLLDPDILMEERERKRSYEYGRAIFRGLRIKGAPQPAPQRADMSPTPRLGM